MPAERVRIVDLLNLGPSESLQIHKDQTTARFTIGLATRLVVLSQDRSEPAV